MTYAFSCICILNFTPCKTQCKRWLKAYKHTNIVSSLSDYIFLQLFSYSWVCVEFKFKSCRHLPCRFSTHELGLSSQKPFAKPIQVVGEIRYLALNYLFTDVQMTLVFLMIIVLSFFLKVFHKFHPNRETTMAQVRMAQVHQVIS